MKLHWLVLLPFAILPACGSEVDDTSLGETSDAIVDVPQSDVERQAIGNCWLYSEASWVESMYRTRYGTNFDRSGERRVGKECRSRGSPYHEKKNLYRQHARD